MAMGVYETKAQAIESGEPGGWFAEAAPKVAHIIVGQLERRVSEVIAHT